MYFFNRILAKTYSSVCSQRLTRSCKYKLIIQVIKLFFSSTLFSFFFYKLYVKCSNRYRNVVVVVIRKLHIFKILRHHFVLLNFFYIIILKKKRKKNSIIS